MAHDQTQILPFHGLRYALDQVKLSDVTAPPYDVIDRPMQERLYAASPYNVVRLILNAVEPEDSERNNAYTRAAESFKTWQTEGMLVPEAQPALYAYSQCWPDESTSGQRIERKGVLALLKLEPYETGRVLPHEFTLRGPKLDRMNLMKKTLGNFSPIFMIDADPNRTVEKTLFGEAAKTFSWQSATDADGTEHRFAAVTDPTLIQQIQTCIAPQKLLIADGHHRYETALAFRAEVRRRIQEQTGSEPPDGALLSDYIMIFLANLYDPGLRVYPTDRVLYQWPADWDQGRFEEALHQRFDVVASNEDFTYQAAGTAPQQLKLKDTGFLGDLHPDLQQLDTAILEQAIFQGILKQTGEALKAKHLLGFYRNPQQVKALLENREAVAVFYMATPPLSLIRQVCEAGHRMPQKSTYFYPKLLSGLAFYRYGHFLGPAPVAHALAGVVSAQPLAEDLFEREALDFAVALRPD